MNCGYNVAHCTVKIRTRYVVIKNVYVCVARMDENYKNATVVDTKVRG